MGCGSPLGRCYGTGHGTTHKHAVKRGTKTEKHAVTDFVYKVKVKVKVHVTANVKINVKVKDKSKGKGHHNRGIR